MLLPAVLVQPSLGNFIMLNTFRILSVLTLSVGNEWTGLCDNKKRRRGSVLLMAECFVASSHMWLDMGSGVD